MEGLKGGCRRKYYPGKDSKVPEKLKKPNFKFELKNTKRIISYSIFFDCEHNTCGQHNTRGAINIFVEIIVQKLVPQLVE